MNCTSSLMIEFLITVVQDETDALLQDASGSQSDTADEEGLLFYDCEEGWEGKSSAMLSRNVSRASLSYPHDIDRLSDYYDGLSPYGRRSTGQLTRLLGDLPSDISRGGGGGDGRRAMSSSSSGREMVVTCVETLFVFAEFGFWQVCKYVVCYRSSHYDNIYIFHGS